MLLNSFFKIIRQQQEEEKILFTIELIVDHLLYAGHFPKRPIVPGVCSIGIIKECAALYLNAPLQFSSLDRCKFLNPIEPLLNKNLSVAITINPINEVEYSLAGSIFNQDISFVYIISKIIKQ